MTTFHAIELHAILITTVMVIVISQCNVNYNTTHIHLSGFWSCRNPLCFIAIFAKGNRSLVVLVWLSYLLLLQIRLVACLSL